MVSVPTFWTDGPYQWGGGWIGYYNNHILTRFPCRAVPVTNLTENERILLTRFRTGSHSLAIETGRFSNTPRENRLCLCGSVQTVLHIFTDCPLTRDLLVDKPYVNLQSIFDDPHVHSLIVSIAKPLKLSLGWMHAGELYHREGEMGK